MATSLSSSQESVSHRVSAESIVNVLPAEFTALVDQLTNVSVTDPSATVLTNIDGPLVHKNASVTRLALSTFIGVVMGLAIGGVLSRGHAPFSTDHPRPGLSQAPSFEESFDNVRIR